MWCRIIMNKQLGLALVYKLERASKVKEPTLVETNLTALLVVTAKFYCKRRNLLFYLYRAYSKIISRTKYTYNLAYEGFPI
jgi:hypothetical protein